MVGLVLLRLCFYIHIITLVLLFSTDFHVFVV